MSRLLRFFILFFALSTGAVHAGLQEASRGMYLSSVTDPQAMATLRSNGFYLGQISVRPVGRSFTLVQFAPPRISAGCGGIDVFFGAFSFINGAQFEQMIRSIIAVAPSFILKMAIEKMCGTCANVLNKLEDVMNTVNQLGRSSCQIAGALFSSDVKERERYQNHVQGLASRLKTAVGEAADSIGGMVTAAAEPVTKNAQDAGGNRPDGDARKALDLSGDITCKAFERNKGQAQTLYDYFGETESKRMVQSLVGTVYFAAALEGGETCPSGTAEGNCAKPNPYLTPTIASYNELFRRREPTSDPLTFLAPVSTCDKAPVKATDGSWKGVSALVREKLLGGETPVDASGKALTGTVVSDAIRGDGLNADATKMLQAFGGNLYTLIREANRAGGEGFAVIVADHYITQFIVPAMEYHIANSIHRMVNLVFDDAKGAGDIASDSLKVLDRRKELGSEMLAITSRYNSQSMLDAHNRALWAIQLHQGLRAASTPSSKR